MSLRKTQKRSRNFLGSSVLLLSLGLLASCNSINNATAPEELKDGIAANAAIAPEMAQRYRNGNATTTQMQTYLDQNAEAWKELDIYMNRSSR